MDVACLQPNTRPVCLCSNGADREGMLRGAGNLLSRPSAKLTVEKCGLSTTRRTRGAFFMRDRHPHDRRQVLKVIVGGVATALVLPSTWSKPIISTIVAPAHAQASR